MIYVENASVEALVNLSFFAWHSGVASPLRRAGRSEADESGCVVTSSLPLPSLGGGSRLLMPPATRSRCLLLRVSRTKRESQSA